jgi:thiamine biosynthesis lipoprotein
MKKYEYSFKALWTLCIINVVNKDDKDLNKTINQCYEKIINFENEFSRFKESSVLSNLNRIKKLEVSEDFLSLIYHSREIFKLTDWYFNPLVDVRKIGYTHNFEDKNFEKLDLENEDLSFNEVKNYWNLLEIGKYMTLDFWSIAKWYLSEKISKFLSEKWFNNNFVNLWWDIYVSWKNLEWKKWQVWINSPFWNEKPIEVLELSNCSISTSWTYLRNWEIWWEKFHHIRNPFSQEQENELVSVSIIHEKWYMTDALATAIIAMWKEKAVDFCDKNKIKYLFVLSSWEVFRNV